MVIKKLNTFFHRNSRWLFGAFTIVIIVSFLGFLTPGTFGFGDMSNPGSISMGTAYGESVTYNELREIGRNVSVFSEVFNGVPISRDLPNENIFIFACINRKAEKMGLTVSDKEIAALIRRAPAFQKNGSFDKAAYDTAVKNLRRNGISQDDLYAACRQQLLLEKFQKELTGGISVTQGEAEELYRKLNTTYFVRVIEFPAAKAASVKVTDAEVQKYFAGHRSAYTIPGKVTALVAAFPYKNYRNAAAKLATEKALKDYLAKNVKSFETDKIKNPKYAAVKNAVRTKFIETQSVELANKAAYDFAANAYDKLAEIPAKDKEKAFRALAAKAKVAVINAGTADFGAAAIGKVKSARLIQQLAALAGNNTVTDPIPEEDAVYIGFSRKRSMPRPAEYKEVAAKVKADCRADKASADAMKKAGAAFAEFSKAKKGTANRLFAKYKTCKFSNFDFSLMTKRPPEAFTQAAVTVLNLNVGAFAAPMKTANGAVIVQLTRRSAADMKNFDKEKELYTMMCRQQKMELANAALMDEFAANCRFTGNGQQN